MQTLCVVQSLTIIIVFSPPNYSRDNPSWNLSTPLPPHLRPSLSGKSSLTLKARSSGAGFIICYLPKEITLIQYQLNWLIRKLSSYGIRSPKEGQPKDWLIQWPNKIIEKQILPIFLLLPPQHEFCPQYCFALKFATTATPSNNVHMQRKSVCFFFCLFVSFQVDTKLVAKAKSGRRPLTPQGWTASLPVQSFLTLPLASHVQSVSSPVSSSFRAWSASD